MTNIKTVKTKDFVKYVESKGFEFKSQKGSHARYSKKGIQRPVIIPTNKKELAFFVVTNSLKIMGITVDEFIAEF